MPRYGFNFQWMFKYTEGAEPPPPDLEALEFMVDHDLDFVRIPLDYRWWTDGTAYTEPDEQIFEHLDDYVMACQERELHCSLNLHRAPGYCINRNELETHNLWTDAEAQEGFVHIWRCFADRFSTIEPDYLSFDLLNEPPPIGRYELTRESHADLMRRCIAAIGEIDAERPITLDGLDAGNLAMPELADTGACQSARGYAPMALSHYQADWWPGSGGLSEPVWPGCEWEGEAWDLDRLRAFYQPWRELQAQGVEIHVGEFGCFKATPNEVALAWFEDLLGLYKEWGWGYSLWQFAGPFGIIGHDRPGAVYEDYQGYQVDRALLDLYLAHRID